jgi:hypothetical protein
LVVDLYRVEMKRRKFLISAIASAASVELLGCGGSGGGGSFPSGDAPPALPGAVIWNPAPLVFAEGSFASIDLSLTLPARVRRGGVFGVAANSSPLPSQLTLSPSGILSANGPPLSVTSNVIFTYEEP